MGAGVNARSGGRARHRCRCDELRGPTTTGSHTAPAGCGSCRARRCGFALSGALAASTSVRSASLGERTVQRRGCVRITADANDDLKLLVQENTLRWAEEGRIPVRVAGPIKMRQFIFTHTSGPVPRHAVLGVGGVQ